MGVKGFTLAEILIVSVILAVIAGLAVPVYSSMIETSRGNEARTTLSIILMAQKVYKLNSTGSVYWNGGDTTSATINTNLNIDLMPQYYDTNWNVTGTGGTSFLAAVCRGNTGNKCFSIDQTGAIAESGSY